MASNRFDEQYIDLCQRILWEGEKVTNYRPNDNRSAEAGNAIPDHSAQGEQATTTIRIPHEVMRFDLGQEFPILTSKQVAFKTATLEMLWIYQQASNDVRWLQARGIKIWNEWQIDINGIYMGRDINAIFRERHPEETPQDFAYTIGTAYGWIVNRYHLIDNLIETLRQNPGNRRMIMSLWQNEWLPTAALPSCVWNSQWNVIGGRLNVLVTSRSTDVPLGLPFNITQYAVLDYLLAHCLGLEPGQFTFITNDAHIYENQVAGIQEHIERYNQAKQNGTLPKPPMLWINPNIRDFYAFDNSKDLQDIRLLDYKNLGRIQMPITE